MKEESGKSGNVLSLFPALSDRNGLKRIGAAKSFVEQLQLESIEQQKRQQDVEYCVDRFIKGLAANKGWSRPGFCVGLTALLSEIPEIKTEDILEKMRVHLDESRDVDNIKGLIIGRAFCLASLIKSNRAQQDEAAFSTVLTELFKILRSRDYLRQLSVQLIIQLFETSTSVITDALREMVNEKVTRIGPELTTDPDLALLLFRTFQLGLISPAQFRTFWGASEIIPEKENASGKGRSGKSFEKLKNILNSATKRHPKRHPVVDLICTAAIKSDNFAEFWRFYEKDLNRLTWEKKYVVMDALNYCVPLVTSDDQVVAILSGEAARLTRNSLVNKERFLFKQAEEFCSLLSQMVKTAESDRQRLIFVTLFKFTPLTKKICSTITKELNSENQIWFIKWWIETWNSGQDSTFEINIGTVLETRKWLLSTLNQGIKGANSFSNSVLEQAIRTLVASQFFKVTKRSKKCTIEEFKISSRADLSEDIQADLLFTLQNVINVDQSNLLNSTISFIHSSMSQKGVELILDFDPACRDTWNRMDQMTHVTQKHKYSKILTPLIQQCALSIFSERKEEGTLLLADILDLVEKGDASCDDASLLEILLSFFVTETGKNRHMVVNCFRQMASDCTERAITLIAEAIDPTNQNGPLDIEDDEEGDEDDEDENEDGDDRDDEEEKESSDEEEDEGDESDDDEVDNLDELKEKLKAAMGDAAVDSDDDEDSDADDMTDEQMMNIDEAIGSAFKSMGSFKRKERAALNLQKVTFRLRVMDLVEVYLARNQISKPSLLLIRPLLKSTKVRKEQTTISKKATKLLRTEFCQAKKYCREFDPEMVLELVDSVLADLLKCYATDYGHVCQTVVLFLLKTIREKIVKCENLQKKTDDLFEPFLKDFMTKNSTKVTVKFLSDLFQRFPEIFGGHVAALLAFVSSGSNGFRKAVSADLLTKVALTNQQTKSDTLVEFLTNVCQTANTEKPTLSIKPDKQAEIVISIVRYIVKEIERLKSEEELSSTLSDLLSENSLFKRNDVRNATMNALKLLGVESSNSTKEEKESVRQARREVKREKQEARKAKFEQIKKEKIESGNWIEKSKWKSNERKEAKKRKAEEKPEVKKIDKKKPKIEN